MPVLTTASEVERIMTIGPPVQGAERHREHGRVGAAEDLGKTVACMAPKNGRGSSSRFRRGAERHRHARPLDAGMRHRKSRAPSRWTARTPRKIVDGQAPRSGGVRA